MPDYYNSDAYNNPQPAPQQPTPQPAPQQRPGKKKKKSNNKSLQIIIALLLLIVIVLVAWFILSSSSSKKAKEEAFNKQQQAELALEQYKMEQEFNELNDQFISLENQQIIIQDDSVKRELEEKYQAARMQVEMLEKQLRDQRNMSQQEIDKLKNEIATLREILKNYVAQIDQLNKENEQLRAENEQLQNQNTSLSNQVAETSRRNEQLSERMTLAEKLNVTGVSLTALNGKGKTEKNVKKAQQLKVSFTIPQNNSTPTGEKTIYLRIVSPTGQLLGNGGTFDFEGATLTCTAKKTIEYAGQEIGGINIFWDVDMALAGGAYTVELFTDGYRLCSSPFNLN